MLLSPISRTRTARSRLSGLQRSKTGLADDLAADAVAADHPAASDVAAPLVAATRLRSRRQTAATVTAVAVGAVAVGAVAYVWWRHRRDQEFARLLDPEPRHPDPVPADPPDQPLAPEPPSDTTAGDPIDAVATEGPATEESAPDAAPADQPSVGEPEPVPALASDAQPATESAVPRAAVNVVAEGARTSSRRGRDSRPFPVGRQVRGPSVTRIPSFRTKLPSGGPTAVASANKQFARGR